MILRARPSPTRIARLAHHISPKPKTSIRCLSTNYKGTTHPLNTGARIPALGFGTWQDALQQEGAVLAALRAGYRHIDTARIYGTESAVGNAIQKSGVPREEIFLVTKLWNNSHEPRDVEAALDDSLRDLGTEYVDMYLMHWPSPFQRGEAMMPRDEAGNILPGRSDYVETYKAMEECYAKGKARAIGISNFSKDELERLLENTDIVPAAHQLELHPYLAQHHFHALHQTLKIHVTQYSPLGNANQIYSLGQSVSQLISDPLLQAIGAKHGKTGAQTALAWGIAKGRSVIPKSKTTTRIEENFGGDFKLPAEDVRAIDGLDVKLRFNDPSERFGWKFYEGLDGKRA